MSDIFDAVASPTPNPAPKDIFDQIAPDGQKPDIFDAVQPDVNIQRREPPANLDTRQIPVAGGDQPIRINREMNREIPFHPSQLKPDTTGPVGRALRFVGDKMAPVTPKNPGIPRPTAADFQTGNWKGFIPMHGLDPETGESVDSAYLPPDQLTTTAKVAAGAARGVAGVVDAAVPFLIGGTVQSGIRLPLLQRAISAGFAADMLRHTPENVKVFVQAVENDDVQTAVEAGIGTTVGAYFSYKAIQHATGPTKTPKLDAAGEPLKDAKGEPVYETSGIAQESPMIRALLTKKITQEYTPEQVRAIYDKVNLGKANPAEQEFVRFINEAIESPGKAVRKGVVVSEEQSRIESQFWRDYLGLKEGQKTVTLADGSKPVETPESTTRQPQKQIGGPNADNQQSAVAEARPVETQSVPPVAGGASGEVQKPAGAGKDIFDVVAKEVPTLKATDLLKLKPGESTVDQVMALDMEQAGEFFRGNQARQNPTQYDAVLAGMKLKPEDVPQLESLRNGMQQAMLGAISRGDDVAGFALQGKGIWLNGVIEGARRSGPNYDKVNEQSPKPPTINPAPTDTKVIVPPAAQLDVQSMTREQYAEHLAQNPHLSETRGQMGFYNELTKRPELRGKKGISPNKDQQNEIYGRIPDIAKSIGASDPNKPWIHTDIGDSKTKNPDGSRSKLYITFNSWEKDWTAEKIGKFVELLKKNGFNGAVKTYGKAPFQADKLINQFDNIVVHARDNDASNIAYLAANSVWGDSVIQTKGLDATNPSTGEHTSHTDLLAAAVANAVGNRKPIELPKSRYIEEKPKREQAKPAGSSLRKTKAVETPKPIEQGKVGMMLGSGQVVLTTSGRKTEPFPEVKTDTERKTTATLKRVEEWLQRNALAEALSRDDQFNARMFAAEKPGNIPPASKDAMEEYLFGEQPKVIKSPLKDITPKKERAADDVADLTDAELEALMDEAQKPPVKKTEVPNVPVKKPAVNQDVLKPAKVNQPSGSSLRKKESEPSSITALRDAVKKLRQGLPVAEDMAMNDKGASLDRLNKKIDEAQAALDAALAAKALQSGRSGTIPSAPAAKSAADIAKEAAKLGVEGVDEAMKGLHDLFGGGTHTGSGPSFDEKTYAKAKPHFQEAYEKFKASGRSLKDFFQFIFEKFGAAIRPYLKRFMQDLQAEAKGKTDERLDKRGGSAEVTNVKPPAATSGTPGVPDDRRVGGDQPETTEGVGGGRKSDAPGAGGKPPSGGSSDESAGSGDDASRTARDERDVRRSKSPALTTSENYRITDADQLGKGSLKTKLDDNLEAIRLVRLLEKEERPPTSVEQSKLVRYVGWGGIKGVFDEDNAQFNKARAELKKLLTEDEFAAARASVQDAHYTSQTIIQRGIYAALERFGFKGGKMVEGGVGIGNFIGLLPDSMVERTSYIGIERDPLTAKIAQYLYPKAKILLMGFQDADLSRDSFDAAAGNPPFGAKAIFDARFTEASKHTIHNYFIAKTLETLRPGGVAGFVVSRYFLDNADPAARNYVATLGEFLGAIRLPNTAFKENANTEVVTDLVFFKRIAKPDPSPKWTKVVPFKDPKSGLTWKLNQWVKEHPEMVLGEITKAKSGLYSKEEMTVEAPEGQNLGKELDLAVKLLPEKIYEESSAADKIRLNTSKEMDVPNEARVGAYFVKGGKVYRRMPDENATRMAMQPEFGKGAEDRIKGIIPIRDALNELVRLELSPDSSDFAIEKVRQKLNVAYDSFVKKNGYLNSQTNRRAFYDDPNNMRVLGLERDYKPGISSATAKLKNIEAVAPSAKKADIFTKRVNAPYQEVTSVETPKEALTVSLNQRGGVDLEYMASLMGKDTAGIIKELGELVFELPAGGYEVREQYLSGNVRQKFNEARDAAIDRPEFQRNAEALKAVIPKDIDATDIIAPVGAPWVAASDVSKFAEELTGSAPAVVLYRKADGGWSFEHRDRSDRSTQTWGTPRLPFGDLMRLMLNGKPTTVWDEIDNGDGGVTRVVNQDATALADAKATEIRGRWEEWIWKDQERRERLHRIYNDTYNNFVDFKADGSHLTLPGASTLITLNPHQKNVAWRTITNGGKGLLYDHVVGAGKTFAGVASMMELRRINRVRKWLVTVPNHLTGQWADAFNILYPNSNILAAKPSDFSKENRQRLFSKILTGDFDAVILGHSSLKKVGTSPEVESGLLKEILTEIVETIKQMKEAEKGSGRKGGSRAVAQMERTKDNLEAKLKKLANIGERDTVASFEELGFDGLFLDEAHEFKNLFYTTQMQNVAGLGNPAGSAKAFDLFLKTRYLRQQFGDKAPIVFATGTPISNSLVEMFTMQRYLQPAVLDSMGLKTLDAWSKVFADVRSVYEVDPTGTGYRMATRLANFQNVGELTAIYKDMADVITMNDLQAQAEAASKRFPVPKVDGGKPDNIVADRTPDQANYFGIEEQQLDSEGKPVFDTEGNPIVSYPKGTILWRVDNMPDDPKEDNMLKLTSDARKAGLDMRLIDPKYPDRPESKVNRAVSEIAAIYKQWDAQKGTQLVFCDLSVPASARGRATKKAKTGGLGYYIRDRKTGELTAVDGEAVEFKTASDYEFFVRKSEAGNWVITERTSGLSIGASGKTKAAAIEDGERILARIAPEVLKSEVDKAQPTSDQLAELQAKAPEVEPKADDAEDTGGEGVSVDELLADQSKFSVYDDMRAKLIKAGVPTEQIAFIHDYDTPEKKQKLFQRVNDGDVRILFGSTAKMGAGTNVQRRLVALHHMDAPWRPSDLEQREGRAIRQGNLFYEEAIKGYTTPQDYDKDPNSFSVKIKRYATRLTYDTRMWQIIEHKAAGIEAFRRADRSTRSIEDVSGEAANASDMKAAASGDPLIQQEIQLRNDQRKLELLRSAWNKNRIELQNRLNFLKGYEDRYKSKVDQVKEQIKQRDDGTKLGEDGKVEFSVTLPDGTVTDEKGTALEAALSQLVTATIGKYIYFGKYRGFDFSVAKSAWNGVTSVSFYPKKVVEWGTSAVATYSGDDKITGVGVFQKLDNWLKGLEEHIPQAERQRDAEKAQLEEVAKEAAREFPKADELKRVTEEHAKIKTELMGKKKKKFGGGDQPKQAIGQPTDKPITQAEVEQVVRSVLGEIPSNVLFVNDPTQPAGEIIMSGGRRGRIILNLARIDSPATARDVLYEELVHGVWDSPAVANARKVIEKLVTVADEQRKAQAGYNPDETHEEAANERARQIFEDAQAANIFVRAWRAIVKAIKDLFGLNLSESEVQREAAAMIIREATRNEPTARTGRRMSDPTPEKREQVIEEGVKEQWIPTQVMGQTDFVRGREQITPLTTAESLTHARNIFNEAGLSVTRDQSVGGWRLVNTGMDQSAAGRQFAELLRREIQTKNAPGKNGDLLASLLNSVVLNFKAGSMADFDQPTREALYNLAQSDRSQRGLALGALAGFREDLSFVGRNVDVVLSRVYSDAFGGVGVGTLLERVVRNFRSFFTDAEIEQALKSKENAEEIISRIIGLNRREEGGRVYRKVQGLLKPKREKTIAALEADARIGEAVQEILDQAAKQGITPAPNRNKPLSPLRKLLLMVSDKNAAVIDRMIGTAVAQAERNAGIAAALKNAVDDEERQALMQGFAAGEEPSFEAIEEGLDLPEYSHWRDIRDNLIDYSPTTLNLVQQVVKEAFKGTAVVPRKQVADSRMDLNKLAVTPEDEVRRVLDAHYANIEANVRLAKASPETLQRIRQMVQAEVSEQLEAARKRYRSKLFREPPAPGTPETDEQRIAKQINAGLFRDERLDVSAMVERVASKSDLQRLTPKVVDLVKQVLDTPFYRQSDLAKEFSRQLVERYGVAEEQAEAAAKVFGRAFEQKFEEARKSAARQAREAITPQEAAEIGTKKSVWKRIEQAVNAGIFDTGTVLREIAAGQDWKMPTDAEVAQMKQWAEDEQRLRELTPEELEKIGPDPAKIARAKADKEAATMERRVQIKKKMEVEWSKLTRPISMPWTQSYWSNGVNRRNFAAAANEMASANLLLKLGFAPRQVLSVVTQGAIHTPTRAISHAIQAWQLDRQRGRPADLWSDVQVALRDAYKARFASFNAALSATRASFLGRGEARNVDRLMSSIAAVERIAREADIAAEKGEHGKATVLRLFSLIRLGYRVAQALDNVHGVPAEYQEIIHQVERGLREQGKSRIEIEVTKDRVLGNMKADWLLAIDRTRLIFEANGLTPKPGEIEESAWNMVKRWQYDRIRELGLPADDFEESNRLLRSTIGWNERETKGLGGMVGRSVSGLGQLGESLGIPLAIGRFGNAIAISINRQLSFTPFYSLADVGAGESGWTKTETDRTQRKIEAAGGSAVGLAILALAWVGAIIVRLSWPRDPKERELWEAQGIRPGTVEFHLGDGKFIPVSMNTGPLQPFAPYLAAGGALYELGVRQEKAQAKLDAEALKRGVPAGKAPGIDAADMLAVAAKAAHGAIVGGRTSAGLLASVTDYGVPNAQKILSSQISPLIPGLPAMQEVSRMAGVNLDAKLATFWDFLLPLPTSGARKVNMFGQPVKTEDDLQRILQVLTGGTAGVVDTRDARAAYEAVFASGYRPPSIDPGKGHLINNEFRPMTQAELVDYTVKRGEYFKREVEQLGPAPDASALRSAYQRANARALTDSGVTLAAPVTRTVTPPAAPAAMPAARTVAPRRIGGSSLRFGRTLRLRSRRPSVSRGIGRGPSLRLKSGGLKFPKVKGGSLRLGRAKIKRVA